MQLFQNSNHEIGMRRLQILNRISSSTLLLVHLASNGLAVADPFVPTDGRDAPTTAQQATPTPFPPVHTSPPVHTLKVRPRLPAEARDLSGPPLSIASPADRPPPDADVKLVRTVPVTAAPAENAPNSDKP